MKTESWDKAWDSKWRQIRGALKRLADETFQDDAETRAGAFPHEIRLNPDKTLDEVVAVGVVHLEQVHTDSWVLLIGGFDGQQLRIPIFAKSGRKVTAFAERDGGPDDKSQAVRRLEAYVRAARRA